jgi:putative flippase GtrA
MMRQENGGAEAQAMSVWRSFVNWDLLTRLLRFALVSGTGLAIDVGLFLVLVHLGLRAGYANLISATVAVTFVYFVSTRNIFNYAGRFLLPLFLLYLGYQVVAVSAASWAVDLIVALGILPVLAKALILPITFSANYLFLDYLTRTRA